MSDSDDERRQDDAPEADKQKAGKDDDAEGKAGEGEDKDDGDEDDKPKGPPIYKRPLFWIILIPVVDVIWDVCEIQYCLYLIGKAPRGVRDGDKDTNLFSPRVPEASFT